MRVEHASHGLFLKAFYSKASGTEVKSPRHSIVKHFDLSEGENDMKAQAPSLDGSIALDVSTVTTLDSSGESDVPLARTLDTGSRDAVDKLGSVVAELVHRFEESNERVSKLEDVAFNIAGGNQDLEGKVAGIVASKCIPEVVAVINQKFGEHQVRIDDHQVKLDKVFNMVEALTEQVQDLLGVVSPGSIRKQTKKKT